ncbi:IS66 family insertion sequence element accessory protein TnpB [Bradyrhizobium liaoningense]|uniref:IS66 family insertion sequence element accessory protein TnpB n=1 Tax=Bradyrhizobium liaoningense TaxID=43992 RepID=UPI001BA81894|nr:IS66 family insertion sequence element accessory protein TnpB [Bradyrhizobium liaoningense]
MLTPPASFTIYVATQPVDFRKGADGLVLLAKETLGHDPMKGAAVVCQSALDWDPRIASSKMLPNNSADDWGGVTESGRWRQWRAGSAWAQDARCWPRWRGATVRLDELRRDGSLTS